MEPNVLILAVLVQQYVLILGLTCFALDRLVFIHI
jgi:hypothetical protein